MIKVETAQEKIARLRALRESRDGTPEERRERRLRLEAAQHRAQNAAFDSLSRRISARLREPMADAEVPQFLRQVTRCATRLLR